MSILLDHKEKYMQMSYLLSTLFTPLVHVVYSCLDAPKETLCIQNDLSNSVSIFPGHSWLSSFAMLVFAPWKRSLGLTSAFFMTHLIFQCYITVFSISAPSGLCTVYLPVSSVINSEHACKKLCWWARRQKQPAYLTTVSFYVIK